MEKANRRKRFKTTVYLVFLAALLISPISAAAANTFKVLNPEGQQPEIDLHALSPRLQDLSGKTIIIFDGKGGNSKPMENFAAATQGNSASRYQAGRLHTFISKRISTCPL